MLAMALAGLNPAAQTDGATELAGVTALKRERARRVRTPVRLPAKALHWSVSHDVTVARRVVTALAAGSSPRRSGRLRDPRLARGVRRTALAATPNVAFGSVPKSRPVAARAGQGLLGQKAPPQAGLEVSPSRGTSARVGRVTQDVHFRRSRHYVLRYQYKPPGYSRRRGSVAIRALPDLRFGIVSRRLGHLGP